MLLILYIVTICIGFLSPFLSLIVIGHLQNTKKLFLISLSYLAIVILFIYSPFEFYSRVANALLAYTLLLVYGIIWGCLFKLHFRKYLKIVTIILTSLPLVIGVYLAVISLIFPLSIIAISDDIRIDNKIILDNKYFIEENTWGWVATSGKEYRVYKHLIPGLLKYKVDYWRENDMNFNSLSIEVDTTNWNETRAISIIDHEQVLHTFNLK